MDADLTRDIETREESYALSKAAELIADEYHDDTKGGEWTPEIRWAVRKAWIAGRDWQRSQAAGREAALRAALQEIRDAYGRVCEDFELCHHVACESSVGAWMVADRALAAQPAHQDEGATGG